MKKLIFLLLFPLIASAQWSDVVLYWDAARTDTQAAIRGVDSLVSQAFRAQPYMTMQVYVQAGDTASATLDSSKVSLYCQYSSADASVLYTYKWCGETNIGLDSTLYDKSLGGYDGQPGIDISTLCPSAFCRVIAKGLSTNSKAAGDSTKFSVHVIRYETP